MAVPERMLVQVAVTGPRRISITVLPVREPIPIREAPLIRDEAAEHREETVADEGEIVEDYDRRLYDREIPRNEAFPTTLGEFGYRFDRSDPRIKLVNIETGGPFVFDAIPGDRNHNQQRYNALGEVSW